MTRCFRLALVIFLVFVGSHVGPIHAWQSSGTDALNLTAKSANVAETGIPVRINILRWSTDAERKPVVDALDPAAQAAVQAAAASGRGGGGGRGGRGGRGGPQLDPNDPTLAGLDGQPARGGRGRGDAAPAPPDPIATLTAAVAKAPTVGYIWTDEVVGYSIKYAHHTPLPDGGERIIIATDRRLGADTSGWQPVATATRTDYEFTVFEIRMNSKGVGEAKTTLTSKVVFDAQAKTLTLDNYAASPAILQNVNR